LRFIDLIINKGLSVLTFLYLTLLLLPSLLGIILPIALFCSVIFTYHKLISDSELVVFESIGISKLGLTQPAIKLGIILMLVGYLISMYLLPLSYREFKELQYDIKNNYASVLIEAGVFNFPTDNFTIHIREEKNGLLRGILVHDNRDKNKPVTMMAENGEFIQTKSGPYIKLINGNRQEMKNGSLNMLNFDEYTFDIGKYIDKNDKKARKRKRKEKFLFELLEEGSGKSFSEANNRIVWPLYSLALPILALASLLYGEFSRREKWHKIVIAGGICVIFIALGFGLNFLTAEYKIAVLLVYLNVLLVGGGSLKLLRE